MPKKATKGEPDKDLYGLLEVSPRARKEVIDAAFRVLMTTYHPDKKGGDEEVAKALNAAHAVLTDKADRAAYDRRREALGGKIIGGIRIVDMIAEGGFGTTYRGEHLLTGEPVCVKHCSRVSPQDEQVLIQEAKAVWNLRHFALPVMHDLLKLDDGSLALVMSYIPGPTLEQVVKKAGRLDAEHVAWIAERVLNVLMYLHYHGVVHGDLKPQNIIVQPESHSVVLVDFGLAMVKPAAGADSKGYTPYFAPPEEIKGLTLVPESDLYSLGMTMIYALGGGVELVKRIEVPQDTPDPLCEFIRRLIARNVLSRPNWEKENVWETIQAVRKKAFGRAQSGMKAIPGY